MRVSRNNNLGNVGREFLSDLPSFRLHVVTQKAQRLTLLSRGKKEEKSLKKEHFSPVLSDTLTFSSFFIIFFFA